MFHRIATAIGIIVVAAGLAGCSGTRQVQGNEYNDPMYKGDNNGFLDAAGGRVFGTSSKDGSGGDAGGALGVNAYLWRGTLDTLSFMPLASADPFGGVIITDWYTPPAAGTGERFKATAYILGRQLRADGIKLALFRQEQRAGQWVDAPVDASTVTDIENKILERARELRSQSAGSS
jgi:hypothetical protein